jgi:hypothetical protein
MTAKMYLMMVDPENTEFGEVPEVEKKITDFVFDSLKVTGIYKQDEEIMLIFLNGVDIPLVYDEYTYECIAESLRDK